MNIKTIPLSQVMAASQRNQCSCSGPTRERFLFFDRVEAAAVDHPKRRRRAFGVLFKFCELAVEPGEVVGLADPHDCGKDVKPPHTKIEPLPDGRRHPDSFIVFGGTIMASCSPVSSVSIRAQQQRNVKMRFAVAHLKCDFHHRIQTCRILYPRNNCPYQTPGDKCRT